MPAQTPFHIRPGVDPKRLRPRRFWYVIGPSVFFLCCLLAVGAFVWTLSRIGHGLHELGETNNTVHLAPGKDKTLYTNRADEASSSSNSSCHTDGQGKVQLKHVFGSKSLTKNGKTWYAVAQIHATQEGDYRINCQGSGDVQFAVGPKFSVGGLLGGIFAIFVIPAIGFIIGGIIVLVAALRRNGHKKRLLAASGHGPGQWSSGPPPPTSGYPPNGGRRSGGPPVS